METRHIAFNDIRTRILGADFYPFRPKAKIGPRLNYAYTFIYIRSGSGFLVIDGKEYRAETRDLFCIEPGTPHAFAADEHDPMVHASVYADLLWDSTPKQKGDKRLNEYRFASYKPQLSADRVRFTDGIVLPAQTSIPAGADWLEPFLAVIRHFDSQEIGSAIRLRSLFESFVTGFARFLAYPFLPSDLRIRKMIDWMKSNLHESFQLADWAGTLQLSQPYLYELFRKETGTSPGQYFMLRKLEQAKTELRETNRSVTLIADKLGFASVHYFSRQFSGHFGESPNQYRKRMRGASELE
ncbi:helix-turn-helix domain-containing protein [Paenibacillus allorhizosphaerae]|uniref:HTH-type transcriptional activator RhaR n=1 Tax=Paenibacillus allorhizosphaerae TaxID=2849866 RepID=A0ABM8VTJ9_9BACL|nr:AraC family transcriptional regulator [Paenibacillus allorhizosphaerae]CAG7657895.1 HTH-type transcriptional activator RhaR [Paenibacillus allorhizosphaerae]